MKDLPPKKAPSTPPEALPNGSLMRTVRAVAWSFIGLRKGSEYQQDVQKIHPLHIVVVGLVGVFLLVGLLMALVNWIV